MYDPPGFRIQLAQQQPTPSAAPSVTATDRPGVVINLPPGGPAPKSAQRGLDDVASIVQPLIWPLILLVLAIAFRRTLADFFSGAASRIKGVSFAGVAIELVPQPAQSLRLTDAAVDIRHAGTDNDVNDSTLRSFYEQIGSRTPLEFAVVDLGEGREWLTSRLYILAVILKRMRGMQAVVFIDTANNVQDHFVGICASDVIRWRLARAYPKLEAALAAGESRVWSQPNMMLVAQATPPIDDDQGRFTNSNNAAELLRGFLAAIQVPVPPVNYPGPWEPLEATPRGRRGRAGIIEQAPPPAGAGAAVAKPKIYEYAEWVDVPLIEKLLAGALDDEAIQFDAFQFADRSARVRAVVEHQGHWLPLVRADGRFHGLIDRTRVVQSLAVGAVAST